VLDGLEAGDGLAELAALTDVGDRLVLRSLGDAEGLSRDAGREQSNVVCAVNRP